MIIFIFQELKNLLSNMLSVIIPARNEIYLQKTIDDVLKNAGGEIEIIAVCDGYWPDPPIKDDPRVILIHHTTSIGQRQSINEAAKIAKGKYVMKLDAHCAVDKDFDIKLAKDCKYDWTVIPRMYNLDVLTWKPKLHKRTDYMYMGWNDKGQLRALYYNGQEWKRQHRKTALIDDTMCCMGPCFFMHKDRFWELGGCDEKHGGWGQQGVEVACKAWLSGGRLVVNKNTWFSHWFRGGGVPEGHKSGFPYEISGKDVSFSRKYSMDLWLENKWPLAKREFNWLINKFNPPTWDNKQIMPNHTFMGVDLNEIDEEQRLPLNAIFYRNIHRMRNHPYWKGVPILKMPSDLLLYSEVIYNTKPDFIIEIGTRFGGSALYMQDMLDSNGNGGKVITIDVKNTVKHKDPRITYLRGSSVDKKIVKQVKEIVGDKKVMLSLDGDHSRKTVKWELHYYSSMVSSGQYLVIEDCYIDRGKYGPGEARDWFIKNNKNFVQTKLDNKYLVGMNMGGWLKKR